MENKNFALYTFKLSKCIVFSTISKQLDERELLLKFVFERDSNLKKNGTDEIQFCISFHMNHFLIEFVACVAKWL